MTKTKAQIEAILAKQGYTYNTDTKRHERTMDWGEEYVIIRRKGKNNYVFDGYTA